MVLVVKPKVIVSGRNPGGMAPSEVSAQAMTRKRDDPCHLLTGVEQDDVRANALFAVHIGTQAAGAVVQGVHPRLTHASLEDVVAESF